VGRSSRAASIRAWISTAGASVQADSFNRSRIQTAIVAAITSNVELADAPGNVLLPVRSAGLPRDSVVNVSSY
jgi:mRNA-degrading endonuclease toxin of MazEF toxin-antitoxin module